MQDFLKYKGVMTINKFRGAQVERGDNGKWRTVPNTGELIQSLTVDNLFINVGKSWAIQRLFDDTSSVVSGTAAHYFYVGTTVSAGAASATDTTAAITWTNGGQMAFTYASGAIGAMSGTATFITSTANGALTEAGIFAGTPVNAPVTGDGVLIARALFAAINKTSSDTLQVKWDVSIA